MHTHFYRIYIHLKPLGNLAIVLDLCINIVIVNVSNVFDFYLQYNGLGK